MGFKTVNVLSAADTSSQTGSAINVQGGVMASFVPVFGDVSANGTIKIQASNDIVPVGGTPSNWVDITNATSSIASGVGPAIMLSYMCYAWIRVVYTRSSGGSTTISVNMNYYSIY